MVPRGACAPETSRAKHRRHAGNVLFTPDGDTLISPVGNRVTLFNLASSTSVTLPFEHNKSAPAAAL